MAKLLDLTIVIPTLNTEETIVKTLESILPLKKAGAKIILVDSFSTDSTVEFAKPYCDLVISHPKGNMYAAINAGMKEAKTKWVSYINADDLVYSDAILQLFEKNEIVGDLIYGDIDFIDYHGRFLHSYVFTEPKFFIPLAAEAICAMSPIGTVFKKTVWEKLRGFDLSYRYSSDFDFFLRTALQGFRIQKIAKITVGAFRLHSGQLSQHQGSPGLMDNYKIIKHLKLKVSFRKRLFAKLYFKVSNFWEILIRIFRRKRLTSGHNSLDCIAPPNYQ